MDTSHQAINEFQRLYALLLFFILTKDYNLFLNNYHNGIVIYNRPLARVTGDTFARWRLLFLHFKIKYFLVNDYHNKP